MKHHVFEYYQSWSNIYTLLELNSIQAHYFHMRISKFIVKRHYGNTNRRDARNKYNIIKFVYNNKEN